MNSTFFLSRGKGVAYRCRRRSRWGLQVELDRASVVGRVMNMYRIYEADAHALVFSTRIHENQLPITKKVIVSGVMYDQRIFPVGFGFKSQPKTAGGDTSTSKKKVSTLTRMRRRGRTRGAAHRPSRKYTQSAPEDQLRRARAEQGASSIPPSRASAKERKERKDVTGTPPIHRHPLTFACARALISAEAFITSISCALFTHRSFPMSETSGLRFHAGTTSKYDVDDGSDSASKSPDDGAR